MKNHPSWLPTSMAALLVLVQNFLAKIDGYATVLPLTPAQVTQSEALCHAIIGAITSAEQSRQTMMAMTQWRDAVLRSDVMGMPAPPAPVFPVVGAVTYGLGSLRQFVAFRDLIVASPGYTRAIGDDLQIVGVQTSRPLPVAPSFKSVQANGYTVNVVATMNGMDAMRVEYAPRGGEYRTVGFFTNAKSSVHITPSVPGEPETGHLRAIYIKRSAEVGNFSAEYPVTVS